MSKEKDDNPIDKVLMKSRSDFWGAMLYVGLYGIFVVVFNFLVMLVFYFIAKG